MLKLYNHTNQTPKSIKISKDARYIAVGYQNSDLRLFLGASPFNFHLNLINTGQTDIGEVDFDYSNSRIMSCGDDKSFKSYNLSNPAFNVTVNSSPQGDGRACRYSPLGDVGYADDKKSITVYNPAGIKTFD